MMSFFNYTTIATLPANSTSYSDTGLAESTNYRYHILCENAGGVSAFSSATMMTLAIAPSGLTASSTTATRSTRWF